MSLRKSQPLFDLLMKVPDVKDRSRLINHLTSGCAHDLCTHLKKLVYQAPSHRLKRTHHRQGLKQALRPHAPYLKRLFKRHARGRKSFKLPGGQKGAGIFTLIAASVIPILVDLVMKATKG